MQQLRPVIWSKGTLLTPQHLQIQDRFIESVLRFHVDALSFMPWGFKELEIERESLQKGVFALSGASGILPDGLLFSMPDSDPAPESLRITLEKHQQSTDVYLAIPKYLDRGMNVSLQAQTAQSKDAPKLEVSTRFRSAVSVVRDETSAVSEKPVQIARKNFKLLTSQDNFEGRVAMRIARVRKGATAKSLELDPHFVPPLVDISASPYLETIVRRLLEIMSAKSANLGGMRRQRNLSLAEFSAADIPNFWLLYTVNSYLPLLRHIVETRKGHPSHLFDLMLVLAGALTTFSTTVQPKDFPLYDHDDLGDCFRRLDDAIRLLLDSVVKTNFVSLQLKEVRPSIYATALADDRYISATHMFLAVTADMAEDDLIKRVPNLFKISSGDRVEGLMSLAVGGLRLTHSPSPPTIPVKLKYQYFAINQADPEWDVVKRARNLAVYVPSDFRNPQLELWIILPQNA